MASIKTICRRSRSTKYTFVSLYSGAGGLDIGFHKAGFNPVYSVESNQDAIETYRTLFCDHEVVNGRVEDSMPNVKADLVIGGPPCQGFSVAGYANPRDPRSKHIMNFMAVVKAVNPRVFVMENVKALATSAKWANKRKQLKRLANRLGYNGKFYVLDASECGVPQRRERMFFLGVKGECSIKLARSKNAKVLTVRDALEKMPKFGTDGNNTLCTAEIVIARKPVLRGSAYSGMFFNGKGRILDLERPSLTLPASMGGNHTPIVDQKSLLHGTPNWAETCFRRLSRKQRIMRIPNFLRRLTLEEAAALQTFPEKMEFFGSKSSRFKQVGNAVPPRLAYFVAKQIRNSVFLS